VAVVSANGSRLPTRWRNVKGGKRRKRGIGKQQLRTKKSSGRGKQATHKKKNKKEETSCPRTLEKVVATSSRKETKGRRLTKTRGKRREKDRASEKLAQDRRGFKGPKRGQKSHIRHCGPMRGLRKQHFASNFTCGGRFRRKVR